MKNQMDSNKCLIGPHSSISKGILEAVKYSHHIGGNTTQIFLGSNQSTSLKSKTKISPDEIIQVNKWLKENNHILVIHSIYLLNFCNFPPNNSQIKYAQDNLKYDLELTEKLGGIGCVLHIGYQKDLPRQEAYKNMADNVVHILELTKKTAPNTKIIMETPAGKGSQIGTTLPEFAEIWNLIPKKYYKRLGACVDTAHIFSSGRDIRTDEGVRKYFKEFDNLVGIKYLTCFHINDSKALLNSRKDQHEGIGDGYIFGKDKGGSLQALKEIWKFASKHKIPMCLETHSAGFYKAEKDNGRYYQEVQLFRKWDKGESGINFKLKSSHPLPERESSSNDSIKSTKSTTSKKLTKSIKSSKKEKGIHTGKKTKKSPVASKNYLKYETNTKIVDILSKLQKYYKIKNDSIRANSYQRAVYQIKKYSSEITNGDQIKNLEGIGKKMIDKINEILLTGNLKILDELQVDSVIKKENKVKSELEEVFGMGPSIAKKLQAKGIRNIDNLRREQGNLDLTEQQKIGIQYHNNLTQMISRSETKKIYQKLKNLLENNNQFKEVKITLAGSYPSGKEESKDIDIILSTLKYKSKSGITRSKLMEKIVNYLQDVGFIKEILSSGSSKFMGLVKIDNKSPHRHLDMLLVPENCFVTAYLHYTGGKEFNRLIREKAKKKRNAT
jgi:apurinic endonuclease APN1